MKVALINYYDIGGGAARAAYRIHHALRQHGVDSLMYVNESSAGDWTVQRPASKMEKAFTKLRPFVSSLAQRLQQSTNRALHSPAIIPSNWLKRLNSLDADILNLHWVNYEMLSIAELGRIHKPVVWTLHDMWAFCGAEHYTVENRWKEGYVKGNRPSYESGFDLNRWTWQRKRNQWQRPYHIVTPSRWMAECVRQSALMRDWAVTVIPNALDTDVWQPVDKIFARQLMHLPPDVPLLLFGALGGASDPRKGFDLLQSALDQLRGEMKGMEVIVFGSLAPRTPPDLGFHVHYTGHLHDDITLRLLYSASDAMVIPSRQDNLPNTGVESLACGTPVVAFNACGLPDIVDHKQTGYLANAFDVEDLSKGIQWVLADAERHKMLSRAAREKAVRCFSNSVVAAQYQKVYQQAIESQSNTWS